MSKKLLHPKHRAEDAVLPEKSNYKFHVPFMNRWVFGYKRESRL